MVGVSMTVSDFMRKTVYDNDEDNVVDKALEALIPIASDTLRKSDDSEETGTSHQATYEKIKEITVPSRYLAGGTVRIKFSLRKTPNNTGSVKGVIYKNDVLVGTERETASDVPTEYSEDLAFNKEDLIQIYGKVVSGDLSTVISNFRIYCDDDETVIEW